MESYIQSAWTNFSQVVTWCATHTILTIAGNPINFLELGVICLVFQLVSYIIQCAFYDD